MTMIVTIADILMITTLISVLLGFLTWMFKLWKEFNNLKTGMAYRQDDMVMIFRCLRVLLETPLCRGEDVRESLNKTLEELNRHMEKRAAGLTTRGVK